MLRKEIAEPANLDFFEGFKFGEDTMWSMQPQITGGADGTATYTILAGNIDATEANMTPYRAGSTGVPIADSIDSNDFRFEFMGIKYTAGTATGTVTFYNKQKLDR